MDFISRVDAVVLVILTHICKAEAYLADNFPVQLDGVGVKTHSLPPSLRAINITRRCSGKIRQFSCKVGSCYSHPIENVEDNV